MSVIDDYLETLTESQRSALERVRCIVRDTVPEALEVISYGMPAFQYQGKYLLAFSAFKKHLSIFPTAGPIDVHRDKLSDFKVSKGAIRFTPDSQIPEMTLKELVACRVAAIAGL